MIAGMRNKAFTDGGSRGGIGRTSVARGYVERNHETQMIARNNSEDGLTGGGGIKPDLTF